MKTGILITNGSANHSPEVWAAATASHIIDIAKHVAGESRAAAVKLEAAIIDILEKHHASIQEGEKAFCCIRPERHADPHNPNDHVELDAAVAEIVVAASTTPWAADFAQYDMINHLHALLHSHFATSMDIERKLHADHIQGA